MGCPLERAEPFEQQQEAYLRERAGDLALAARLYRDAARAATNLVRVGPVYSRHQRHCRVAAPKIGSLSMIGALLGRPLQPLGGGLMAGAESVEGDVEDVADVTGLGGGDLGDADDHVHDLLEGGIGTHVT